MSLPRMALLTTVLLAIATGAPAKSKSKAPAPAPSPSPSPAAAAEPSARVSPTADGTRVDLSIPGTLWGWAAPREPGGRRALYLLVGPPGDESAGKATCAVTDCAVSRDKPEGRLFRWRANAPDRLELVRSQLPAGGLDAAARAGAPGVEDLLLVRDGAVDRLSTDRGAPKPSETIVRDAELGRAFGDPRLADGVTGDDALRAAVVGALRTWTLAEDGGARLAGTIDIPVDVDPSVGSFRVMSRAIIPIGRGGAGRALYATEPELLGFERVRTVLLDPDGPEDARSLECWGQLPGRERMLESGFVALDGTPALVVLTTAADKLSLFAGKRLRVFALGTDRTRLGGAPRYADETGINLWQDATPFAIDLDADGRDDLVLGYWKGLTHDIAALETRRGLPDGSFGKAHTFEVEVEDGDRGFLDFGHDLDGDGHPDLVLLGGGALRIYPGRPPAEAATKPVASKPSRVIPLSAEMPGAAGAWLAFRASDSSLAFGRGGHGPGDPRFVDFDGDGRPEILFIGGGTGGVRASVVLVRGAATPPPRAAGS